MPLQRKLQKQSGCTSRIVLMLAALIVPVLPLPGEQVVIIPAHQIDETEDAAYAAYVQRALREAAAEKARAVILEIDTPGGELSATFRIKDALLESPVRVITYVNRQAISAGSLLALSGSRLHIAPGGVIGAATPLTIGPEGMAKASEKVVSATRAAWRSVAEKNNRPLAIAEAMVDESVVLTVERNGIAKPAGKLLTLTSEEALRLKVADGISADLDTLLKSEGLSGLTVVRKDPGFFEKLAGFFLNPMISGLLLTLGFLGLVYEIKSPGWGVPGTAALVFLTVYFLSRMALGLSGWGAPALFGLGVLLLALEIFVIPGFGIAGLAGLGAMVGSILLTYGVDDVSEGLWVVSIALGLGLFGVYALLSWLPEWGGRKSGGLVLSETLQNDRESASVRLKDLTGSSGEAISPLRPGGLILIDGERYDAVSQGDFIESGRPVRVTGISGSQLVVREVPADSV